MAKTITLFLPFYPYARQDKKDESRAPISAKLVANLLAATHIDRLIVMDLHAPQIQGFFDIPVDNIYSINLVSNHLNDTIFNKMSVIEKQKKYILVSPDAGGIKRTLKFAKYLKLNSIVMHKQRDYTKPGTVTDMFILGDTHLLNGRIAIICDDMIDSGGTLIKCVDTLTCGENKSDEVYCVVTHGVFSGEAINRINNCDKLTKVIVSDSIPQRNNLIKCDKLEVFSIAKLFSTVVNCLQTGGSISSLFHVDSPSDSLSNEFTVWEMARF